MPFEVTRRRFLHQAGALALFGAADTVQAADAWPSRPIRMLVSYPAGGANDLVARAVSAAIEKQLGANIVVDNRSGAAGAIAAEVAAKAAPDGYTLYMMSSAQVLAPSLRKVTYDPVRDFTAIALSARSSYVLAVHPSVPFRTMAELIAYAKDNPGKLNYASSGVGAGPHLATELFALMADVKLTHVPYRGDTPALTDLLGGQVQMSFMSMAPAVPHVKAGALRPLAVASARRSLIFPDVPTVAEAGLPGYDVGSWWGLVAPAGTPSGIIQRAESVVVSFLREPSTAARFLELALEPGELGAEAFQRYIATEKDKLADIVQRAGIQAE
ncbi:MAG: tripartite tricarboxylate transporter substrate binding protein [Alphaproteobacteria bacterium]|nr:tripartite tricarboxylate transporter substrate binding protein [Alphaproteobacteria bacterium]